MREEAVTADAVSTSVKEGTVPTFDFQLVMDGLVITREPDTVESDEIHSGIALANGKTMGEAAVSWV